MVTRCRSFTQTLNPRPITPNPKPFILSEIMACEPTKALEAHVHVGAQRGEGWADKPDHETQDDEANRPAVS